MCPLWLQRYLYLVIYSHQVGNTSRILRAVLPANTGLIHYNCNINCVDALLRVNITSLNAGSDGRTFTETLRMYKWSRRGSGSKIKCLVRSMMFLTIISTTYALCGLLEPRTNF